MVSSAEIIRAYSNARNVYDRLSKLEPKNWLLEYATPMGDMTFEINSEKKKEFKITFGKEKGNSPEESLAIQMRLYAIAIEKELTILGQKRRISAETSRLLKSLTQR